MLLAVANLCLVIAAQGCVRKVEGVWLQPLDEGSQRVWFKMRGFSVVVPASWEAQPPRPLMRASVQGRAQGGMPVSCMWQVISDPEYRKRKPEELFRGDFSPESMIEYLNDDPNTGGAQILSTESVSVAGHPANHVLYTANTSYKGISMPVEMSTLVVPYSSVVFVSHCGTLAVDFSAAEPEIRSIQHSLRLFDELRSDDDPAGGPSKRHSHGAAETSLWVAFVASMAVGAIGAPRLLMRWPRMAIDLVVAFAILEGTMIVTWVGADYFANEAMVDKMFVPVFLTLIPFLATLGAGLSVLVLPRGASRWSGIALLGASLLPVPATLVMRPLAAAIVFPLIDRIVA
ncbi:MAG TPA: hypothetical protein VFV19_03130 [Candidatus Polarisedimenticolaceae bacterium]|nr:hypothetical protein [Candidatus Polarisedimenticolaceae bacterium]